MSKSVFNPNEKVLIRRYLIWCYKTTKEELDRIERYYTQIQVDHFVLSDLRKTEEFNSSKGSVPFREIVGEFEKYIEDKKRNVDQKKFTDDQQRDLSPDYIYLKCRFSALKKAIKHFLGARELNNICSLYEQEMTGRILQAREHS